MKYLRRDHWNKLPEVIQQACDRFEAKSFYYPSEGEVIDPELVHLPASTYSYETDSYLKYCREALLSKKLDRGLAMSLVQGLRSCGPEGRELAEQIKQTVLRK